MGQRDDPRGKPRALHPRAQGAGAAAHHRDARQRCSGHHLRGLHDRGRRQRGAHGPALPIPERRPHSRLHRGRHQRHARGNLPGVLRGGRRNRVSCRDDRAGHELPRHPLSLRAGTQETCPRSSGRPRLDSALELFVAGCHGGETPRHRTSAFVVDGRIALDAGALTSALTLEEQGKLEAVLVSHAHLDHVRDLATIADNRIQMGSPTLDVYGPPATLRALARHFFNDRIWPDFTKLPTPERPTVRLCPLRVGKPTAIGAYEVTAVPVHHTIDCSGFVVSSGEVAIGYSGDTGPTDRFWS
ncbi:MAG: 3',5'-cyclic-nucleotide phosphodiesterase, partial [Myxococcales bacterium]